MLGSIKNSLPASPSVWCSGSFSKRRAEKQCMCACPRVGEKPLETSAEGLSKTENSPELFKHCLWQRMRNVADILPQKPELCNPADSQGFGRGRGSTMLISTRNVHMVFVWCYFSHPQAQYLLGFSLPGALCCQQKKRTVSKLAHMSPKPTLGWDESSPGMNQPPQWLQGNLHDSPRAVITHSGMPVVNWGESFLFLITFIALNWESGAARQSWQYLDPKACGKLQFPPL